MAGLFLDSNVLMDYWFKRADPRTGEPWFVYAENLLQTIVAGQNTAVASTFSLGHLRRFMLKELGLKEKDYLEAKSHFTGEVGITIRKVLPEHQHFADWYLASHKLPGDMWEDCVNLAIAKEECDYFITRTSIL